MPLRRSLLKAGGALGVGVALGVGTELHPIRTHLYDVRLVNRRSEAIGVDLRLDAEGETAFRSTIGLDPAELIHLPCEWPRAAWSYRMAVRPADHDEWQTITWNEGEKLCKKIAIEEAGRSVGPVSFYESSCPTSFDDHSCARE